MPRRQDRPVSRRTMMQSAFLTGGALAAANLVRPTPARAAEALSLKKDAVVLFQGDSITDCGRNRNSKGANDRAGLAHGYPYMITAYLLATQPQLNLQCHNRGISGHKVPDLDKRWQEDCLDLKPDVLSILIGVNDIWHKLNGRYDGTVETYEKGYTALLERTKEALPKTQIIVCEPFVLRCGAVNDKWFPEMDHRRAAAKRVAEKAGATWVPFQSVFDEATAGNVEPSYWAGDGVHPSIAGHALMAKTWIETAGL